MRVVHSSCYKLLTEAQRNSPLNALSVMSEIYDSYMYHGVPCHVSVVT